MLLSIPLAWLQLAKEKTRFSVALAGVAFAVVLMLMQFGFEGALVKSAGSLHASLKGDLFMISPRSSSIAAMRQFSQRRLYQTLAFQGVQSVTPVYLDFALWRNPVTKNTRSMCVIAFNPVHRALDMPAVERGASSLKLKDQILFDELSRPEFGPVREHVRRSMPFQTEVGNRRIRVAGLFRLGASFGADGNMIASDTTFFRLGLQHGRKPGLIDIGAINLEQGVSPEAVRRNMIQGLPDDVLILSRQELIKREQDYWRESTAIGFIFSIGAVIGFVVGAVIVYQILYADVLEHRAEYATLKAIGYTDGYLLGLVLEQSTIMAVLGSVPGVLISACLYAVTREATLLPMNMELERCALVLMLTLAMCFISGAFATQKLRSVDPAAVF